MPIGVSPIRIKTEIQSNPNLIVKSDWIGLKIFEKLDFQIGLTEITVILGYIFYKKMTAKYLGNPKIFNYLSEIFFTFVVPSSFPLLYLSRPSDSSLESLLSIEDLLLSFVLLTTWGTLLFFSILILVLIFLLLLLPISFFMEVVLVFSFLIPLNLFDFVIYIVLGRHNKIPLNLTLKSKFLSKIPRVRNLNLKGRGWKIDLRYWSTLLRKKRLLGFEQFANTATWSIIVILRGMEPVLSGSYI